MSTADSLDVIELGPGVVVLRGSAVVDASRAVEAWIRLAERRDALKPPERLVDLRAALNRARKAAMSSWRLGAVASTTDRAGLAVVDNVRHTCSTSEAAVLLGLSLRQIQRRVAEFGGVKVSGRWRLDRAAVVAAAEHDDEES